MFQLFLKSKTTAFYRIEHVFVNILKWSLFGLLPFVRKGQSSSLGLVLRNWFITQKICVLYSGGGLALFFIDAKVLSLHEFADLLLKACEKNVFADTFKEFVLCYMVLSFLNNQYYQRVWYIFCLKENLHDLFVF